MGWREKVRRHTAVRDTTARRMAAVVAHCEGRKRVSLRMVAERLEMSPRTVRRYLEALRDAGATVPELESRYRC